MEFECQLIQNNRIKQSYGIKTMKERYKWIRSHI